MPLQVFLDDSGGKGQGRFFVLAGWLASAEAWATFSEEWRACLGAAPKIDRLKMSEAARREGAFKGLTESERDDKLRDLTRVIQRHASGSFHCTTDLYAFADTYGRYGKPFRDPYFWPFHISIMATCFDLYERGCRERYEIIFDEQAIFGPRAKAWYPLVRAVLKQDRPESAILPVEPMFRTDDEFLPLQAADLLAWAFRRTMQAGPGGSLDPDFGLRFGWLVKELEKVPMSGYSQALNRERMAGIVSELHADYEMFRRLGSVEVKALLDDLRD